LILNLDKSGKMPELLPSEFIRITGMTKIIFQLILKGLKVIGLFAGCILAFLVYGLLINSKSIKNKIGIKTPKMLLV